MAGESTARYLFGDLLALARLAWLREMEGRLEAIGYPGYLRTDAISVRLLVRTPMSMTRLGSALGISRQAAKKVADGLVRRGFATTGRDLADARRINVELTPAGREYATVVIGVIEELNETVVARLDPASLVAVDAALRASILDDRIRSRADALVQPPVVS